MQKKSEKKETETIAIRSEVRTISKSYIVYPFFHNQKRCFDAYHNSCSVEIKCKSRYCYCQVKRYTFMKSLLKPRVG